MNHGVIAALKRCATQNQGQNRVFSSLLEIDVSQASGSAIEDYGYLKSKPSKPKMALEDQLHAADLLLHFVEAAKAEKEVPAEHSPPLHQPSH